MIARSMTFAAQLTRMWVAMYTAGLPEELACTRRDEVESDLWEQDVAGDVPNGEALARLVLGMPADVSWRFEQRTTQRASAEIGDGVRARSGKVFATAAQRGVPVLTALLAGLYLVPSFIMLFGGGEWDSEAVRAVYGVVGVLVGAAILAGLLLSSRSPWLGSGLVITGAIVGAVLWFWFFYVLVPVTLLVVGFAIARARRVSNDRTVPA